MLTVTAQRRVRVVAALVFVLGTWGCSRNADEDIVIAEPADPALSGRFFASAGESESISDLYEMKFSPFRLSKLSTTGRVFGMDGCASKLVVTIADKSVGFADELRRFTGNGFAMIDGLADPSGALPDVAPDCRMAFLRLDKTNDPPTDRLMVFDPQTEQTSELRTAAFADNKTLGVLTWGPDGQVAVIEGTAPEPGVPGRVTGIVVIASDGSERILGPPVSEFGTITWAPSEWMALADQEKGTVFLHPDTGEQVQLPGWLPLTWSPDGQRLLVASAPDRTTLGLVELPDLTSARKVASTEDVAVFDVVWLPADATAGGKSTLDRPEVGDGEG